MAKGRNPQSVGVYNSYSEAVGQIMGISRACWQKVGSQEVGDEFIQAVHSKHQKMSSTPHEWYAIAKGGTPQSTGVYSSWAAVQPKVNGISGACHVSMKMEAEGMAFIKAFMEAEWKASLQEVWTEPES